MFRAFFKKICMVQRSNPVIFVTGCTGTGKSDLGIAIARNYNGEVISADSMQIYKGLDIVTNKVTTEETMGIPHHLMSFVDPGFDGYNVNDFQRSALNIIDMIRAKNKIPVIVGGTAYYIESVLYEDNLIKTEPNDCFSQYDNLTNDEVHNLLKEVDETAATQIHPNNRARVLRALDIYKLTGKPKSKLLKEQHERNGGQGRPRFKNTLVITMDANKDVLDNRLDTRIEKMLYAGLKKELEIFYLKHESTLGEITHGVLQCIGPKEFLPYLRAKEKWNTEEGSKKFEEACKELQLHTRQYARKQRRWIKSRFHQRSLGSEICVVSVDSSDKETFIDTGLQIVDKWIKGANTDEDKVHFANTATATDETNTLFHCTDCDRIISGRNSWDIHLAGKPHRKRLAATKKRQERLEQLIKHSF